MQELESDTKIAENREVGDNRVMGVGFSSETALESKEQQLSSPLSRCGLLGEVRI